VSHLGYNAPVSQKANWRAKLHPIFFELAELNRKSEIGLKQIQGGFAKAMRRARGKANLRESIAAEFRKRTEKLELEIEAKLVEINARYPKLSYNPIAYSYFDLKPGSSADNLFAYLHWMRHRESVEVTVSNDAKGDLKAYRKLVRTGEDYRRIAHKKGPLKPFQGDTVHRQFLELMLCFEIKPLTAEERADCADAYCACGKTHDPDALKKQLGRLNLELTASGRHVAKPKRRK
jgi:hypothetical protein